jgi:hypothetical protein
MAIKLITTEDFGWDEAPVSLFHRWSRGIEMPRGVKVASVLCEEVSKLKPKKNETLVHTLAVGSTDRYGPNRNGDGFTREWNKKAHDRFVKNGHVFKHHANKDPAKACGSIKLSGYNEDMDRIELIIGLDNVKCADEIQQLSSGRDLPGSMGCRVAFDVCSICQHKAPSPKEYCSHAKLAMTRILDDGRQVYVDNPDPHYFDWSLVGRPADRIAYGYGIKTASFDDPFLFSTELAKMAGLVLPDSMLEEERQSIKLAILGKLSAMEKEIEAKLTPVDDALGSSMCSGALSSSDAKALKGIGLPNAMELLHSAQVILPAKDFLKLISADQQEDLSEYSSQVESQLPGIFGEMQDDPDDMLDTFGFDGGGQCCPPGIGSLINNMIDSFGMGPQPLGRRVTVTIIKGKPISGRVVKTASDDMAVKGLARLYAQYKLGALSHPANVSDDALLRASVVQHYYRNN